MAQYVGFMCTTIVINIRGIINIYSLTTTQRMCYIWLMYLIHDCDIIAVYTYQLNMTSILIGKFMAMQKIVSFKYAAKFQEQK